MKSLTNMLVALLAIAAIDTDSWARSSSIDVAPHKFKLRVQATLRRNISPTPLPIRFTGPGRAVACRSGVRVWFDVLTADGQHGKAVVFWNNPLSYRPFAPLFAGRGKAVVFLPHAQFSFRLGIRGAISRTRDGRLIIHARFRSRQGEDTDAKFNGHFVGIER